MDESQSTLPADWYVDPARYHQERSTIFGREWLWFASLEQLPTPNSYFASEYAGYPLMVVRGSDGELRGFHNVCRHRAGPLVDEGVGVCGNLVCRYHGWAYGWDGALRSARDFDGEIDTDEYSLFAVAVQVWRGQVFVNLDCSAVPLLDDLSALFREVEEFPVEAMRLANASHHDLACNWKTYADNYLEGYHIPMMHPELNREFDAKQYRVDTGDRYCRHSAPARAGEATDGRWLFRWPNLAINIYGDAMNIEVIVPTGPQTCRVLYNHFFIDPEHQNVSGVLRLSDVVMEQDRAMVEVVQRNLAAGRYRQGRLSPRHENGLAQFQDLVRQAANRDSSVGDDSSVSNGR